VPVCGATGQLGSYPGVIVRMFLALGAFALTAAAPPPIAPVEVPVELAVASPTPMSGRLIVFAEPAKRGDQVPVSISATASPALTASSTT
jgi:hypothetical protein